MVIDRTRDQRSGDGDRSNDRRDRGQVILIGAVALAFIVLGVVVVFNGVLYTETLSSADTGQTASSADAAELEVRQGVACLVAETGNGEWHEFSDSEELEAEIEAYTALYRSSKANSHPTAVNVTPASDSALDVLDTSENASVTITYDSDDISYSQTVEISPAECPRAPSIERFDPNPDGDGNYTADWTVSSRGSDLAKANVTLLDEGTVVATNTTSDFDNDDYHDGESRLVPDSDNVTHARIVVSDESGYTAARTEPID